MPATASLDADAKAFGDALDAWNKVYLGGRLLPGRAVVSGDGVEHSIDVKKSPGKNGATITDTGRDIAKVIIKLTLWTPAQWREAKDLRDFLQPLSKDKKLQGLDVQHPALNWAGVDSLYVYKVGFPQLGSQAGTIELELSCLEYRKGSTTDVTNTILGSKTITARDDPQAANQTMSTPDGHLSSRRVEATRPSATDAVPAPVNFSSANPTNFTPG